MTARLALAILAVVLATAVAGAGGAEVEAERGYRAAGELAAAGERARAIDAFEVVGALRPVNRWTDNAWSEAARLAEQAREFARARRALEQVLATSEDVRMLDRARGALERLDAMTAGGADDAVAAEHERLVARVHGGGDPREALAALAALVRAHPAYPRATAVRLALAQGHERDGAGDEAMVWAQEAYARARPEERMRAGADLVRVAIRIGELDAAGAALDDLAARPGADRATIAELRDDLAVAQRRAWIRIALGIALGIVAIGAVVALRIACGRWGAAARALAAPPIEVLYSVPIALTLVVVAHTGNVLVAAAVRAIAVAGVAIAWLSGAVLEAYRRRDGRITPLRAAVHAVVVTLAVVASAYLAVDHHRMIDLVTETWRSGPAQR
ncbi:MAG: hypothetical protein KF773_31875 [Deltaproteobacteria bacterium]|nr:hypothetical protein [Deltaproteobacteria bacterium]